MANIRTKVETAFMRDCFERYYALGEGRRISRVARDCHKSPRTLLRWSDSFNWAGRVQERDRRIADEVARKTIRDIVETKVAYRKIIKLAVQRFAEALMEQDENGEYRLKINTVSDFEKAVKLDLLLMGEATEAIKTETTIQPLTSEDREALKELTKAIVGDIAAAVNDNYEEQESH